MIVFTGILKVKARALEIHVWEFPCPKDLGCTCRFLGSLLFYRDFISFSCDDDNRLNRNQCSVINTKFLGGKNSSEL